MPDCEKYLWKIVRTVEPTQTQKDGGARSQNYLRDVLCTGNMAARITGHYLSGSYARDTAVYPLDDVDIIFVIDPDRWPGRSNVLSNIFFGAERFPDSTSVLESFANAIRYRYPVSSVFGQRRSVRLQLYHLDIDVVPAIIQPGNPKYIYIPDKEANQWIVSSPLLHAENATSANKFQGGKLKPLVKLLKYWNGNLPSTARFKSFAIETLCVLMFRNLQMNTLQKGLRYFFDFVASFSGSKGIFEWRDRYGISLGWLSPTIPDAANTGSNLIVRLEDERRRRFIEHATRSRGKLIDASKTSSVDTACRRLSEALKM
jgi:hypothetical protein